MVNKMGRKWNSVRGRVRVRVGERAALDREEQIEGERWTLIAGGRDRSGIERTLE